ncbi:uncharacterized protein LOC128391476 [Panonychus citri]|uniref:uncharacterized protein LOC128391476 n=1 Tax=Panonychus citri TaxID=50023 RepID=UPI002306EB78|nr:uncharacterized protein LOC128391476 [Panonychus citri]
MSDISKLIREIGTAITSNITYENLVNKMTEKSLCEAVVKINCQLQNENEVSSWSPEDIVNANQIIKFFGDKVNLKKTPRKTPQKQKNQVPANQQTLSQFIGKKRSSVSILNAPAKKKKVDQVDLASTGSDNMDEATNDGVTDTDIDTEVDNETDAQQSELEELNLDVNAVGVTVEDFHLSKTKRSKVISKRYKEEDEVPEGWYKVDHLAPKPIVLIEKIENIDEIDLMLEHVKGVLEVEDSDFGEIDEIVTTNKFVKVTFKNTYNRDLFCRYSEKNQEGWTVTIPTLRNPCIRVVNVDSLIHLKDDEIIDRIVKKNRFTLNEETVMKIVHRVTRKNGMTLILEVSPIIRELIYRRKGKLMIGYKSFQVSDSFALKTCHTCLSYGHNNCNQQIYCRYCSLGHLGKCKIKGNKKLYKCKSCLRLGHQFNDPSCEVFQTKMSFELQYINYTYEWVMAGKLE